MANGQSGFIAALLALLPLTVIAAPDLFVEAGVEPQQVYVQSQALYRLRFYQAVDVRELKLVGPTARLADVRATGEARVYEAQRDGRRYRVHERSYALFPFASGALELSGGYATGKLPAPLAESADGWRAMRIEAPGAKLAVLPAPVGAANWLPARALTLSESGLPEAGEVALGKALRRTIRIEAAGVDAGALPEIRFDVPGMTLHAEAPRLSSRFESNMNIAVREQTFQMTPWKAGEVAIPELRLEWWSAATASPAVAVLPARVLRVAAGAAETAPPPKTAVNKSANPSPVVARGHTSAMLSGIAGVLLTLLYFARHALRARWQMFHACRTGDVVAVRDGLLAWVAKRGLNILSLGALAERLPDAPARQALNALERAIYGPRSVGSEVVSLPDTVRIVKRALRFSRLWHP